MCRISKRITSALQIRWSTGMKECCPLCDLLHPLWHGRRQRWVCQRLKLVEGVLFDAAFVAEICCVRVCQEPDEDDEEDGDHKEHQQHVSSPLNLCPVSEGGS
eukprot:TRINITY_DN6615_c0_g1_i1.p1 TRINITY_DN6615_c0_g1~~TRINITY_DN6615_c0_g1_i1.p1  ORF type:complete len:103 (+),score=12.04 TRINITY_DN6615_c0_g1_i1:157-465(+)